jgi:hypothetical protein
LDGQAQAVSKIMTSLMDSQNKLLGMTKADDGNSTARGRRYKGKQFNGAPLPVKSHGAAAMLFMIAVISS